MAEYYDFVLALIPLALGGVALGLTGAGVAATVAVPVASLVAVALIGHAMFVNAPVDTPSPSDAHSTPAGRSDSFQPAD